MSENYPPTAEEVCRTIELMLLISDTEDERLDLIYRMLHCREGCTCKNPHEDWVKEFRDQQAYWENANKPPDSSKIHQGILDEEKVMFAMFKLGDTVVHPKDGWQQRYCESIDKVAEEYKVSKDELAAAFMRHYGPSFLIKGIL